MATKQDNGMKIKIIILVALLVAFAGGYLVARAKYKPQILTLSNMVDSKSAEMEQIKDNANKVMMNDTKMWVVKDGIVTEMTEVVTLSNGYKVAPDGIVTVTDGTTMQLEENEALDMDGNPIE